MDKRKKIPAAKPTGRITEYNSKDIFSSNDETVFFHLRDSVHEFTIGLKDILRCLEFAENQGAVPRISRKWWDLKACDYIDFIKYNEPPDDKDEHE